MDNHLFESHLNSETSQVQAGKLIRILLADAHQIIQEGLRQEIEKHEDLIVVETTVDGYQAIQLAERVRPHVIVLDVNLSSLSGIQVARQLDAIKRQKPGEHHPVVLVFSSYQDKQYIWSMLAAGAKGYLLKSDPLEAVVAGIRAAASGHTVLNQQVQNTLLRFIPELHQDLSQSEINVLQLLAHGLSNNEIAKSLNITEGTVRSHLHNTYRKVPWVRTRAEAVAWAWINRIVSR